MRNQTADPSSMQDACHMNFVIDLAHRSLCGSMVEHRSVESEGLGFDSLWGLRIFSLSHARDKTKNIFLHVFTELKTNHASYFIYKQEQNSGTRGAAGCH